MTLDSPITHPEPGMLVYMVVGETEVNGVILKGVVIYSQESGGPVGWMRFEEADLAKDALLKGKMVTGVIQGPVSDELWGTRSRKGPTFCNKASVFWEEWD